MFEDDSMDYQDMSDYTEDYDQMDAEDGYGGENPFDRHEGFQKDTRDFHPLYYKCYPVYGYEHCKPRCEKPKFDCRRKECYPPMKCKCYPDSYGCDCHKKQHNRGSGKKCGLFGWGRQY